jgi:hypothetical protein
MTDEEMAVNWIRSQGWSEENLPSDELLQMEQAYLAGLKAGKDMAEADLATVAYMQGAERYKPKWHNVAGGDLPPEDTKVLALLAPNEICIAHFYRRNVWDKIGTVIAWCEIPQYTEE